MDIKADEYIPPGMIVMCNPAFEGRVYDAVEAMQKVQELTEQLAGVEKDLRFYRDTYNATCEVVAEYDTDLLGNSPDLPTLVKRLADRRYEAGVRYGAKMMHTDVVHAAEMALSEAKVWRI